MMESPTPEALLELYNICIAGHSTESIREAEKHLLRFQSFPEFVPNNAAIIYEPKVPFLARKFATVYLNKFSKRLIKEKQPQKCQIVMQQYLAILSNPTLQIEIKCLFVSSVEVLLHPESNRLLKIEYHKQYVKLVNDAAAQQDSQIDFLLVALSGEAIFIKDSYSEEIKEIIKSTVLSLMQLVMRLVKRASEQSLQNRDMFLTIVRVLKEYSILLKMYFKKLVLLDIESMKILYLPELQALITAVLQLNYKENVINSTIFVSIPSDELISKLINIIKTNFLTVLTNSVRLIFTFTKHANLIANNPLYLKMPGIITYFVKSTVSLLEIVPYYQLPTKIMILETLDEVMSLLINSMRANNFYLTFSEHKQEIIEKIILPCLSFTPKDIQNFYEDYQEFVNSTIHIVTRDIKVVGIPHPSNEQPQEQIKQYQTLKTLAAQFLNTFCKFQDGTLSHVIEYSLAVLSNEQQGQKSLVLLIISILCHQFKDRKDLKMKVASKIFELIENCPIPVINGTKKQEDLEYANLLLTLSKLFFVIIEFHPNIVNQAYKTGIGIIQSPSVNQVHKYYVFELFNHLARIEQASRYAQDLMAIYNHVLNNMGQGTIHLLESYFVLIKYNVEEFKKNPSGLIEAVKIICLLVQKEVQKPQHNIVLLSKYWNVIREIGESEDFIPSLINPIEESVIPLLGYIDGVKNVDYQEDVLMLLTSFIEKGKGVTLGQQKMFEIIPKLFYGQYYCRFGHSFHAIQLFIFYGSEVLINNYPAINAIIDMSLSSITNLQYRKRPVAQNQNCEGVLILQSLVLKCGQVFNAQTWTAIIKCIIKRLQESKIKFTFFSSNLYGLLSLALIHAHKFFTSEENEILIIKIICQMRLFSKVQYSPKVIIAGLTELLLLSEFQFIARRFTQVLDTVITLLEITSSKKESLFAEEEDEEKQYSNSIIMLKNNIKTLDEFTYFRNQVEKLKAKNLPLLQRSVVELPKAKKDFFTHILRIERVANEPRQIYKIKR